MPCTVEPGCAKNSNRVSVSAMGRSDRSPVVKQDRLQRLLKGQFLRSALKVGGGGALGQAAVVLASPILTRLFDPVDFGVYSLYASLVLIVGGVACLRFDVSIPVPKRDSTAVALGQVAAGWLLMTAGLTALVSAFVVASGILSDTQHMSPVWAGLLVFLGTVGYGGYQLLNYWAVRRHLYAALGQTRIIRGVMQVVVQIVAGASGAGSQGLVAGHAFGHLFGFAAIGRDFWRAVRAVPFRWPRLLWAARRYRSYAFFSAPAALIANATLQLPPVLLAIFYDPGTAGFYAIAQRVVAAPAGIVGLAISQVFMSETMTLARSSRISLRRPYLRAISLAFLMGLVPIGAIAFGGPWLFGWAFGSQWTESGSFVRAMAAMFIAQFSIYPVSQTLHAIERPDLQLMSDVVRMLLGLGFLVTLASLRVPAVDALLGYSIAMTISYAFNAWLGYRALGGQPVKSRKRHS